MMDHARYRMLISADPHSSDPELRAHRDGCAECSLYTEQLLRFESRLERALQVDIASRAQVLPFTRSAATRPPKSWRWLAIAEANTALVLTTSGGFALNGPAVRWDHRMWK